MNNGARIASTDASGTLRRGVALILLAAVLWSLNGPLIKLLHGGGADGWSIACYRSLIAALALTPFALRSVRRVRFDPYLLLGALAFTAMTTTFILSTTLTSAANAIFLQYTAPLWVFALSPRLLGERSEPRDRFVLVVGLLGVIVIFAGQGDTPQGPGLIMGLAGGLFFGLLLIVLRHLRAYEPMVVTWINNVGSAVLLLPVAGALSTLAVDVNQVGLLLLLGVVQFAIPYLLFSAGLRSVPAHRASLLTLVEPILNPTWTWLAVGEVPHVATVAGGGLILGAVAIQVILSMRRIR